MKKQKINKWRKNVNNHSPIQDIVANGQYQEYSLSADSIPKESFGIIGRAGEYQFTIGELKSIAALQYPNSGINSGGGGFNSGPITKIGNDFTLNIRKAANTPSDFSTWSTEIIITGNDSGKTKTVPITVNKRS